MKKLMMQTAAAMVVGGAILSAVAGGPDVAPAPMVTPGLYVGLGGAWTSMDVRRQYSLQEYDTDVSPSYIESGLDQLVNNHVTGAPLVQLGYWAPIDNEWLWGVQATYKYLGFTTDVSVANLLNMNANTDMQNGLAKTAFNNELLLLAYAGVQFDKGYAYMGAGAVMFTYRDYVGTGSNGTVGGDSYSTNFSTQTGTVWGGAFQVGYNYYFKPDWFLNVNYTFAMSATKSISNTEDNGWANDGAADDSVSYTINRSIQVTSQEFMFSINKVFAM